MSFKTGFGTSFFLTQTFIHPSIYGLFTSFKKQNHFITEKNELMTP